MVERSERDPLCMKDWQNKEQKINPFLWFWKLANTKSSTISRSEVCTGHSVYRHWVPSSLVSLRPKMRPKSGLKGGRKPAEMFSNILASLPRSLELPTTTTTTTDGSIESPLKVGPLENWSPRNLSFFWRAKFFLRRLKTEGWFQCDQMTHF